MAETTAIYMIRPTPAKKSALARIVADLEQQRGSVPGFIGTNLAVYTDDFLDWAVVITFDSRDSLSRWLSSDSHTRFLDALEQQGLAKDPEMTELEPGGRPPLGCAVITHRVKRYQTEPFLDYYRDFTERVVSPAARDKGVKTEANVARAGVSQIRPGRAEVLVFVNQVTTSKDRPTPALATSSVLVTLVNTDGRWLISDFKPI